RIQRLVAATKVGDSHRRKGCGTEAPGRARRWHPAKEEARPFLQGSKGACRSSGQDRYRRTGAGGALPFARRPGVQSERNQGGRREGAACIVGEGAGGDGTTVGGIGGAVIPGVTTDRRVAGRSLAAP